MILDKPLSLLFIEPREPKKLNRSNSIKFKWLKELLNTSVNGTYNELNHSFVKGGGYMGIHRCSCGEVSTDCDILLPNKMVTNSLAYHYVVYHTSEIPQIELFKLEQLQCFLNLEYKENDLLANLASVMLNV